MLWNLDTVFYTHVIATSQKLFLDKLLSWVFFMDHNVKKCRKKCISLAPNYICPKTKSMHYIKKSFCKVAITACMNMYTKFEVSSFFGLLGTFAKNCHNIDGEILNFGGGHLEKIFFLKNESVYFHFRSRLMFSKKEISKFG